MTPIEPTNEAAAPTFFHDGCNLCLDIARTLGGAIAGLRIVDLGLQPQLAAQAAAQGVAELPSLIVNGKVMPIAPHSRIDAH